MYISKFKVNYIFYYIVLKVSNIIFFVNIYLLMLLKKDDTKLSF